MNRTYGHILNLTLLHDYYTNGLTPDFVIFPTTSTKNLLTKHRLIFKNTANGFFIGCDNPTLDTLPAILAEKTLSFFLKLKNTSFMNFTDLPPRSGSKDIYYLICMAEGDGLLPLETIALHPPIFTYSFIAAGNTTNVQVEDPQGNIRIDETFSGTAGQQLDTSINLEGYTTGLYRFIVEGQPDENLYIADESVRDIFGLAEITLGDFIGFDPDTYQLSQYQFQFSARFSVWEYHLRFGKDYNGYTFDLIDKGEGNTFTETVGPFGYDQDSYSIFTSQDPIVYREEARTGLQLAVTHMGVTERYGNISSPSITNPEPKVNLII